MVSAELSDQRDSSRRARILVVDDEEQVRTLVTWQLESENFDVLAAADGDSALRQVTASAPDLMVLDLSLPGKGGLEVLATVRRSDSLPIVVLTARRDETERIVALDLGADDYVIKPFSPRELAARIRAVLRRSSTTPAHEEVLRFGNLEIDVAGREVRLRGEPLFFTAKEFDLLAYMASAPMQVFSRRRLLLEVWKSSPDWQQDATVTEHVHRIRRKIENDPTRPRILQTVRGAGYRFNGERT
ncbi:response regulator transcription factor [Rhodococcus pyridinivorans]|nr:response regulator transcription factor [Rhodococcus pyridinivorans]